MASVVAESKPPESKTTARFCATVLTRVGVGYGFLAQAWIRGRDAAIRNRERAARRIADVCALEWRSRHVEQGLNVMASAVKRVTAGQDVAYAASIQVGIISSDSAA